MIEYNTTKDIQDVVKESLIYLKLAEFWRIAKNNGLNSYAIGLKGSQNYNLDDEESDYDANLVFVPTLTQLRTGEKHSFKTEFGEVTCHNIYKFAEICQKGNPQWVEVVNSPYQIGSFEIFYDFDINPSALKGMVMEKVHAFDKKYEGRKHIVEQFGYDPKQLHHIIRLYDLLVQELPIYQYFAEQRKKMLDIKRGRFPKTKEEAFKMRDEYVEKINSIYEENKSLYKPVEINYDVIDKIVVDKLNDR